MITNLKTTIWALALLFSVAGVLVLSSCGSDDEPDPEPPIEIVAPGDFTYPATPVAVGSEGSVDPSTVEGTDPTFAITAITDKDDVAVTADFFSVDAATGKISVAMESTTGLYKVTVTATNSKGTGSGTAEITVGVNDDFNPTGKGYTWQYYMNQDEPWTLSGLDGEIANMPIPSIDIPTGWPAEWPNPTADWATPGYLDQYLALGQIADLLMQVPSDIACAAVEESGDQLYFEIEDDLTLTTICHIDGTPGQSVQIGTSTLSYADGVYSWALNLASQIEITYIFDVTNSETFIDPLDSFDGDGNPIPREYSALRGMVEKFTTPTDVTNEAAILTSLAQKKVEVIFEVHEL